jgi:hypothetical protein
LRSQNMQSAASPAMVPSRNWLISITFLTVCEAAGAQGHSGRVSGILLRAAPPAAAPWAAAGAGAAPPKP